MTTLDEDDASSCDSDDSDIGNLMAQASKTCSSQSALKRRLQATPQSVHRAACNNDDDDDDEDDNVQVLVQASSRKRGRKAATNLDCRMAQLEHQAILNDNKRMEAQQRRQALQAEQNKNDSDDDDDEDMDLGDLKNFVRRDKENKNNTNNKSTTTTTRRVTRSMQQTKATQPPSTKPPPATQAKQVSIDLTDSPLTDRLPKPLEIVDDDDDYGLSSDDEEQAKSNVPPHELVAAAGMDPSALVELAKAREAQRQLQQAQAYHAEDVEARALHQQFLAQGQVTSSSSHEDPFRVVQLHVATELHVVDGSQGPRTVTVRAAMRGDETFAILNQRLVQALNLVQPPKKPTTKPPKTILATFKYGSQTLQPTRTLNWYQIPGPNAQIQAKFILSQSWSQQSSQSSSQPSANSNNNNNQWGKPMALVVRLVSSGAKHTVQHGLNQPLAHLLDTVRQTVGMSNTSIHLEFDGQRLRLDQTPKHYGTCTKTRVG